MRRFALRCTTVLAMIVPGAAWAQTSIPPAPKDFAASALQSDTYEILAADVAVVQSQDPRVRRFAQQMIQDHQRLSAELSQVLVSSGLPPPPPGIGADQASLLASLQSLRGRDFDKAYIHQQALAHEEAVALDASFADSGANPALRAAAEGDLPTLRAHLKMAQSLSEALDGG